jgi:hypothetical protein
MKAYVAMPVFPVLRPSVLKKDFSPNYPLVRYEGRISFDNTMPRIDARKYERPAYERLPSRAECASMFGQVFERLLAESA